MATQLQIRRGSAAQISAFTGAEGEIVVNTTNDSVHVNDGSTAGGFEMARADLNNVSDTSLNAALTGNTVSALTITTLTLGATAITATGAELNILDGVTATAAELNILDGVTSTAAELNILDGVTATTAELNYVDGVTSAIQTQIDTKAPLASPTFTGTVTAAGLTVDTSDQVIINHSADGGGIRIDSTNATNTGSLRFGDVADNYIGAVEYNHTNDSMSFYANNSTRMTIDSSGNVGIGTTSPATKLAVSGGYISQTDGTRTLYLGSDGTGGLFGTTTDHYLRFITNNSERMRIDASGNVAIGSSSATARLEVTGAFAYASGANSLATTVSKAAARIRGSSDASTSLFFGSLTNDAEQYIQSANGAGSAADDLALNPYGGNVGIGTSSPNASADLHVADTSDARIWLEATSGDTMELYAGTNVSLFNRSNNALTFGTNNAERMRIDSSGNAIFTKSGGAYLQLKDASAVRGAINVGTSDGLIFTTGSSFTERMRIDSSGNLLVGKSVTTIGTSGFQVATDGSVYSSIASSNTYHVYNTASPAYTFYVNVNGGIYNYSGNNSNLSDEREKKNIENLESQWDSLKQWSLKKFHYNADADSDTKKLGVIAQEVEAHNPEVVSEFNVNENTTRMAVKEQQMMWMAIKALQEAQTRIETLEAKVQQLENN